MQEERRERKSDRRELGLSKAGTWKQRVEEADAKAPSPDTRSQSVNNSMWDSGGDRKRRWTCLLQSSTSHKAWLSNDRTTLQEDTRFLFFKDEKNV